MRGTNQTRQLDEFSDTCDARRRKSRRSLRHSRRCRVGLILGLFRGYFVADDSLDDRLENLAGHCLEQFGIQLG